MVPLLIFAIFAIPSEATSLRPLRGSSGYLKTREARHVLPIATFTTLAAQLRKKDKERQGRKKKRDTTSQEGLVELALSQAAEFGIRPEELQGRLDEVLDVQKVLEVVEEGRKMADVDLLRELFWKSESLEELQTVYKEKLDGLVEEGAKAVNLKKGEQLMKEGEEFLAPIQTKITTAAEQINNGLNHLYSTISGFWNQDATTKQKREATGTDLVELAVRRAEDLGLHPYELQGRLHEVLDIQRVLNVMREGGKIADFDLLKEMFWESGSLEELQAFYKAKLEGLVKEGVQAVNLKRGRELLEEGKGMLAPLKTAATKVNQGFNRLYSTISGFWSPGDYARE